MDIVSNSRINTSRILRLRLYSIKFILLCIPPFHLIYLYAILLHVQGNKPNPNKALFLYIFGLLLVSLILSAFFLINLPGVFQSKWLSGQLLLFLYGIISLYLMLLIHLAFVTVEFDRKNAIHKYFEFTDIDYFTRFFTLLCSPFTLWWLQLKYLSKDKINQFESDDLEPKPTDQ